MSKNKHVVTRQKNIIREGETYDVLSIQSENGNGTKNTRKKRHLQKKGKGKRHVAVGT